MTNDEFLRWLQDPDRRPLIMGILNVTPDSFSDGGAFLDAGRARAHAQEMCASGAEMIDVGGESTRPGSARVGAAEQLRRILPVLRAISGIVPAVLSVDTTRSEVARAALDCGASLINDISAGRDDPGIFDLAAQTGSAMVLMHMQGEPGTMQVAPHYDDVVEEVIAFLLGRLAAAEAAGIPRHRLLLDPGIGFGKSVEHNLALLRGLPRLGELHRPLLVGTSRKGFIGRITGQADPSGRLIGTAATVAWTIANGGAIVRVHDVKPMAEVVRVIQAIRLARVPEPPFS